MRQRLLDKNGQINTVFGLQEPLKTGLPSTDTVLRPTSSDNRLDYTVIGIFSMASLN